MKEFIVNAASEEMQGHLQRVVDGEYLIPRIAFDPPPVVLDIGANLGAYSFWASQQFPGAKIFAYEPNAENCAEYHRNMALNKVENAVLNRVAILPRSEREVTLFAGANSGMHSIYSGMAGQSSEIFTAPILHPADLPDCDIIKLDIEGPEFDVLEAYLRTHEKAPALISYEFHSAAVRLQLETLLQAEYVLGTCAQCYFTLGTCNWARRDIISR